MRAKGDRTIVDLTPVREREDLKTAAVGQKRMRPTHELLYAAQFGDELRARPQHQVIGIGQDNPRAGGGYLLGRLGLDERLRAHRHKNRRLDYRPRRGEAAATRLA
jgi:hypothetical protein